MTHDHLMLAFGLTVFAGLSTVIGSFMAFLSKSFNPNFLSGSLGFSAGVMIYVSFVEIFVKADASLSAVHGEAFGHWLTVVAFFGGIAVIALIDWMVPNHKNPHKIRNMSEHGAIPSLDTGCLHRMGVLSALAIAIHNVPEGIAVSVPIY